MLREHRDTLVSVLETFVHDPLCEWTKRERGAEDADNPQAKDALATLEGGPKPRTRMPLGSQGRRLYCVHPLVKDEVPRRVRPPCDSRGHA